MDRLPPHAIETEQSLLGALLVDRDAIAGIAEILTPDAFYQHANSEIFRAMVALFNARIPADSTTLTRFLERHDKLDEVGGIAYLSHLLTVVPTAVHAPFYAEEILLCARMRAVIEAGQQLVGRGYDVRSGEPDYDDLFKQMRKLVAKHEPGSSDIPELGEQASSLQVKTIARWDGELVENNARFHVAGIDRMTAGGLRAQQLGIVLARTSMGKTAFALHVARRNRAVIFSLEMAEDEILNRLISTEAGVRYDLAMQPVADLAKQEQWLKASELIAGLPITVIDNSRASVTTTRMELIANRLKAERDINLIVIDHLGHIADQFRANGEYERTSELVLRCKRLAQATNLPVLLLGQLNRGVEDRNGCVPRMSDARGSGRIEEVADVLMTLYRRRWYVDHTGLEPSPDDFIADWVTGREFETTQIEIHKNRNGSTGRVDVGWHGETMRFHDITRKAA